MKAQKVIGIIASHFLPHLGGVERYVFNLATELSARGHQIIIITSQLPDMTNHEKMNGFEVYRLPCWVFMDSRLPFIKPNKAFRETLKKIDGFSYDEILINTRLYELSAWGVRWCRKRHISPILLEHGSAHINFESKLTSVVGECYEHMLTWYIKRNCQTYAGVSKECNRWLRHFKIYTDMVLYNAVNRKDYEDVKLKFRKNLGISDSAMVITFAGRLIPEKGILKLLSACQELNNENIPYYLLIAGDGELSGRIRDMCSERIIMLGSLTHDEVISLLMETNIYCLPTDYPEGFPTAILEAAMCGCCIVATEAGGTKELIVDDGFGCLLKENSVEEIMDVLRSLFQTPDIMKERGYNVRQRVLDNFTWEKTADAFERIMGER